jgi:hypothetical protein
MTVCILSLGRVGSVHAECRTYKLVILIRTLQKPELP